MSERVFQSEYFKEIPKARALLRLGLRPHREGAGSIAATSRRGHLGGLHPSDVSSVSKNRIAVGEVVTPLRLQVGRMAERAGAEVRQKASEDVIKLQALRTAHDPDEHQQQRDHERDRPRARPPVRPARDHARDGIKRSDSRDNHHGVDSPSFPSPRAFSWGRVLRMLAALYTRHGFTALIDSRAPRNDVSPRGIIVLPPDDPYSRTVWPSARVIEEMSSFFKNRIAEGRDAATSRALASTRAQSRARRPAR